jgi:hypothetical protein
MKQIAQNCPRIIKNPKRWFFFRISVDQKPCGFRFLVSSFWLLKAHEIERKMDKKLRKYRPKGFFVKYMNFQR